MSDTAENSRIIDLIPHIYISLIQIKLQFSLFILLLWKIKIFFTSQNCIIYTWIRYCCTSVLHYSALCYTMSENVYKNAAI